MPHKANDPRRHKFPKARYRIDNWRTYDAALRDRGDLTVWMTPETLALQLRFVWVSDLLGQHDVESMDGGWDG